jgi:hypothetical protein
MKLNLLPQTVSKGRALKTAWFFGALLMVGSLFLAIFLSVSAQGALTSAQAEAEGNKQGAADAVITAAHADDIVASAQDVIRDANLSKAMIDHNDVYPELYGEVLPYVPSFFRLTSISAAPIDGTTARVTLVGTVGSYEEYSDVILALMRYKLATTISRSGYNYDPTIVPNLTPEDPIGAPRKQDATAVPQDQLAKLAYLESQPRQEGYLDQGNFGASGTDTKGAMPGQSEITIVMTVTKDLQAPDPQATLAAAGGAAGAAAATTGAPGFGGPGGPPPGTIPGGPPPGALGQGGPPGGRLGAPAAGTGRGKGTADGD